MREGTDGVVAWDENPQTGLREKTGLEFAEHKRGSIFNIETKLKTAYPKMTVTGRDTVNGRPAIVIDAIPDQGSPVKIFFDSETGSDPETDRHARNTGRPDHVRELLRRLPHRSTASSSRTRSARSRHASPASSASPR